MIPWNKQRVLVLAPHPDDEAFGSGGLIHRVKRAGGKVFVMYMTVGTTHDFSKRGVSTKDERIKEVERAARSLRLDGYRFVFPGNQYHLKLDTVPQKDLINEIERGKRISLESTRPTMVIATAPGDYNQDHRAVAMALMAAARPAPPAQKHSPATVLFSEFTGNAWTAAGHITPPSFFVDLRADDLAAKVKAVRCYKSQLKYPNSPISVKGVTTLAAMRGMQSGTRWAEAYTVKRLVV